MDKGFYMSVNINSHLLKGEDGRNYVLSSSLQGIQNLKSFMRKVIYENELFATHYTTSNGLQHKRVSSLGKHFRHLQSYGDLFSSGYTFSPLIEFFFEEYRKHPIKDCICANQGQDAIGAELFNDFVKTMRLHAVDKKLKKRVSNWVSKSKKNMKRLERFEVELFKRYSQLVVIRLDLSYHANVFKLDEINAVMNNAAFKKTRDINDYLGEKQVTQDEPIHVRVAFEDVQRDRERLVSSMKGKPSLFKNLVGYVWNIECGAVAGYHIHLLLFFDGSKVQKHEYLAQEIGNYWKLEITNGRGYFENCNREKNSYGDSWALGEINHWDTVKRKKLISAMQYFCKTNQLVQMMPVPGCHLFGSGFTRRQRFTFGERPRSKIVDIDNHQAR